MSINSLLNMGGTSMLTTGAQLLGGISQIGAGIGGYQSANQHAKAIEAAGAISARRMARIGLYNYGNRRAAAAKNRANPNRGSARDMIEAGAYFDGENIAIDRYNHLMAAERSRQAGTANLIQGFGAGLATIVTASGSLLDQPDADSTPPLMHASSSGLDTGAGYRNVYGQQVGYTDQGEVRVAI